jgi:hypothetical protein
MTRGRHRQVDTSTHFCPNPDCAYRGWVGWGNLRANGHPSGGPWRQLLCIVCRGYFLETLGTIFHGKRVAPELIVGWNLTCLWVHAIPIVSRYMYIEVVVNPKIIQDWPFSGWDGGDMGHTFLISACKQEKPCK